MDTHLNSIEVYDADLYLRLSKEDGDKEESDSITNQKELILGFLKTQEDIRIHAIRVDDGYSGVDFQRPAFQKMLEDIRNGKVNCVITKDLSRFGRNHIEVGKYIEKIFPYLGVRFIAVNDHYDSKSADRQGMDIVVPFKNLINDAYCRDISMKIRSSLEVKRKRGDFVGAFAPYGYRRSDTDKSKLEIDEEAAETVRDIFQLYLQGYSAYKIAERLNERAVSTPMDHKKEQGSAYHTSFKKKVRSQWTHMTVWRILSSPVYTGTLVQGKGTTPNYKVKKRIRRDESRWSRVEGTHEAIIPMAQYEVVQTLLQMDTRTGNAKEKLYPLSGIVRCGDCGAGMVRKTVSSKGKKFVYYICGANKGDKQICSSHRINADVLEKTVLTLLSHQIKSVLDIEEVLDKIEEERHKAAEVEKKDEQLVKKKEEIQKIHCARLDLYDDYKEGLITKEEYHELKKIYEERGRSAERAAEILREEMDMLISDQGYRYAWIEEFKRYRDLTQLSREVVVSLIESILVYEKKEKERYPRIEVHFRYAEEFRISLELVEDLCHKGNEQVKGGS